MKVQSEASDIFGIYSSAIRWQNFLDTSSFIIIINSSFTATKITFRVVFRSRGLGQNLRINLKSPQKAKQKKLEVCTVQLCVACFQCRRFDSKSGAGELFQFLLRIIFSHSLQYVNMFHVRHLCLIIVQETTISEVEGEEGNFLAGPEWKVNFF